MLLVLGTELCITQTSRARTCKNNGGLENNVSCQSKKILVVVIAVAFVVVEDVVVCPGKLVDVVETVDVDVKVVVDLQSMT